MLKPPLNEDHAMVCGFVIASCLKVISETTTFQYRVDVLTDTDGVYMDAFDIHAPSGKYRVTVSVINDIIQNNLAELDAILDA